MAIEKLTADVAVHQTLGDEPNTENSLTADDLKKRFDAPAEAIKKYINETLAPNAMDKRGDTMAGELDMDGNALAGLPEPTQANHAATKDYVDNKIHFSETEPSDWKEGDIWLKPVEEA